VVFRRAKAEIAVQLVFTGDGAWRLKSDLPGATAVASATTKVSTTVRMTPPGGLRIPLSALEIDQTLSTLSQSSSGLTYEDADVLTTLPNQPPVPGSQNKRFRIVRSTYGERELTLVAEGIAGTDGIVSVVRNAPVVPKLQDRSAGSAGLKLGEVSLQMPDEGGRPAPAPLIFHFPKGEGWKTITVTLTW